MGYNKDGKWWKYDKNEKFTNTPREMLKSPRVAAGGNFSLIFDRHPPFDTGAHAGGSRFAIIKTTWISGTYYSLNRNTSIDIGENHILVVDLDSNLRAVGKNMDGQLGVGTTVDYFSITGETRLDHDRNEYVTAANENVLEWPIVSENVVQVAAGSYHSLFIKKDRTLWGVGENINGQLGVEDPLDQFLPVQITENVARVESGHEFSLFIVPDEKYPTITQQPKNHKLTEGESLELTATFQGSNPFYYQWQKNGENIPGANAPTLVLENVSKSGAATYSVTAINAIGQITSEEAILEVQSLLPHAGTVWGFDVSHEGGEPEEWRMNIPFEKIVNDSIEFVSGWVIKKDGTLLIGDTEWADDITQLDRRKGMFYFRTNKGKIFRVLANEDYYKYIKPENRNSSDISAENVAQVLGYDDGCFYIKENNTLYAHPLSTRVFPLAINSELTLVGSRVKKLNRSSNRFHILKNDGSLWIHDWNNVNNTEVDTEVLDLVDGRGSDNRVGVNYSVSYVKNDGTFHEHGFRTAQNPPYPFILTLDEIIAENVIKVTGTRDGYIYLKRDGTLWAIGAKDDRGEPIFIDENVIRIDTPTHYTKAETPLPEIIQHPSSRKHLSGGNGRLEVRAEGDGLLYYQWRRNGTTLPGETSETLVLDNLQPWDTGYYDVMVYNSAGPVYSNPAKISVEWGATLSAEMDSENIATIHLTTNKEGKWTVESSGSMTNWREVGTITTESGKGSWKDTKSWPQRFYRAKFLP